MTKEEHLHQLLSDVERATDRARELTIGLDREQRMWKPGPKKWSVAECFEHLLLTGERWQSTIQSALQDAEPVHSSAEESYRPSLWGRFFLGMTGEKIWIPMPTHPIFEPEDDVAADAPERFLERQKGLLQLFEEARRFDLRAVRVAFPQWSRLRLRLGEALALVVRHQHRHLQQAERVTQENDFPTGMPERRWR